MLPFAKGIIAGSAAEPGERHQAHPRQEKTMADSYQVINFVMSISMGSGRLRQSVETTSDLAQRMDRILALQCQACGGSCRKLGNALQSLAD